MGGAESAMMCKQCGGRWRQGPRAPLIMGASRRTTLIRLKSQTLEEVLGNFVPPMRPMPELEFIRPIAKASSSRSSGRNDQTTDEEPLSRSEVWPRRSRSRRAEVGAEMTWENYVEGWTTAED